MAIDIPVPMLKARRAKGSLIVNGQDILADVAAENIISFCYTDNTTDQADDLSIDIADPKRTWMQRYLPKKGLKVEAFIYVEDWKGPLDNNRLRCGTFYIDEVHLHGGRGGCTVGMKGTSIPTGGFKSEDKDRAWENTDLKAISGQIAEENDLELWFDTEENPETKRTDQVGKPDIEYVRERAKEAGLSMKVHDGKLVVYSEKEYESRDAAFTLVYGSTNIMDFEFTSKCDDCYDECENSYLNPETGKLNKASFKPDEPPEGVKSTYRLNEKVEYRKDGSADWKYQGPVPQGRLVRTPGVPIDYELVAPAQNEGKGEGGQEEGERKCQSKLREKNKKEKQCSFEVVGNISYLSGLCIALQGFGIFDGKWFIETSTHDVSAGGYTTRLTLRNTLKGY